jgi:hypothetical protein
MESFFFSRLFDQPCSENRMTGQPIISCAA